jgi:hypothetical protein
MIEADTRKALLSLECELLCPETRRSKYRLSELLADEFVEFGSSGRVCDKHSVIDSLLQLDSTEHYQIDDFRLVNCCDHTAFVTYSPVLPDPIPAKSSGNQTAVPCGSWKMVAGKLFFTREPKQNDRRKKEVCCARCRNRRFSGSRQAHAAPW